MVGSPCCASQHDHSHNRGEALVMAGPEEEIAAAVGGRSRLRASHADREQVIATLKAAFVAGRLAKDEFDLRVGITLAARTYADLAALTADIPPAPPGARPASPPSPARRRPLARAAAMSGGFLGIAFAAVWVGGNVLDPNGPGPHPYHSWARLALLIALAAVFTALVILVDGVGTAVEQRRSRRQLPPPSEPGGHALDGGQRGGTGHDPVPPGPRPDHTRADLPIHQLWQNRRPFAPEPAGHRVA
jgi:MFS family permease